jgi:tetratricopeptide (TPR) repeat protein
MPVVTIQQAFDFALQHYGAGRWEEAAAIYGNILSLQPTNHVAHANLGETYRARGQFDEAIRCYEHALLLKPDFAEAHLQWGNTLREQHKPIAAMAAYRRAIQCQPNYAEAYSNLGNALRELGCDDEAIAAYRQALEIAPGAAVVWSNLAAALWEQRKIAETAAACQRALAINPDLPEALHIQGNLFWAERKPEDAVVAYQRAIQRSPRDLAPHNNLAVALTELGRLEEAIEECRIVLQSDPAQPGAHNNLANVYFERGQLEEALREYQRALDLDPHYSEAKFGLAMLHLLRGDFAHGWPLYESRWKAWGVPQRKFIQPLWDGSPLRGRRILVHAEQGLGDSIQFVRYAKLLVELGGEVIVECPRTLLDLCRTSEAVHAVVQTGDPLPLFDVHIPMLQLPASFHTSAANIPAPIPYLAADLHKRQAWRKLLGDACHGGLRVGLVWASNPVNRLSRRRDLPRQALQPFLQVTGIDFYSLQVGTPTKKDWGDLPPGHITDFTNRLHDFADTAALMMELDLVISVDTAVAHLAGALARPVWTLLPFIPDWRWGLTGETSPWYPTMRLFRQPALGDWDSVVRRVADALERAKITRVF